ncbi:hypothetical protein [Chromobacterium haemolyticum]|uniref:hypothetical protein n=1 Tax=Chromobacterium haemolyticum TaxID=394935 RepID=UPI0011B2473E|nr:hypothetical protein [Chromobacterium haemolyticum]
MQQNLIDAARAVIAADRAGELTDELINALEAAANAEAGPAGAPVAWRYIRRANGEVILDSIELNPWMPELLEDIRQHYDVEEIPLYATPQPATSEEKQHD